jgi:hypothetical protein
MDSRSQIAKIPDPHVVVAPCLVTFENEYRQVNFYERNQTKIQAMKPERSSSMLGWRSSEQSSSTSTKKKRKVCNWPH